MRRLSILALICAFAASVWFTGCSKPSAPVPVSADDKSGSALAERQMPEIPSTTPVAAADATAQPAVDLAGTGQAFDIPVAAPQATVQEKYDTALLDALNRLADRKYEDALASLEIARAVQDTEQIRLEIDKVKSLIEQQKSAEKTAETIKTVLNDGNADDAARLATTSLSQFGPTDQSDKLADLKRQADAVTAAQVDDNQVKYARFRREGESALAEKNLRAASIAYDQALQYGDDPRIREQYDDIRARLARYDDNRRRAAELRRDPSQLEDALAALQDAAAAWDTLQVRQDIDLYQLALQKRRDRISVADFEVRGEVGIPYAGRTMAEELLPAFKLRFDLVERSQLGKVIDELKLEGSDLIESDQGRRELGRLAKIRYLVVGSISRMSGITVNARLIDVRSGLIVQTAKIMAVSPDDLLPRLPQLANLLMMSDDQKIAYENQLAQQSRVVIKPVDYSAPLPPVPVVVVGDPLPPPILIYNPRPPAFGGLVLQDLDRLQPQGPTLAVGLVAERNGPVRPRLLHLAVSLGDNLFRRGRYQEAHRHFQLALDLSPGHLDLQIRLDRCRPHLPPPPVVLPETVVVVAPPPVIVVPPRPRIAVLNFVVNADPSRAPPGFGDWAADQLAGYFTPAYEVVDRGELYWYMGRLGLTVRDVAVDPGARRWLGRALNVRYFAFGIVQQTASFNVSTHLVDAESGVKQGVGNIHVQDHQELKLRLSELAGQTKANPTDQKQTQLLARENERRLNQVRGLLKAGQSGQALQAGQEALKKNPQDVAMQSLVAQAEQQTRAAALEPLRRKEAEEQKAAQLVQVRKQQELARAAETAKLKAQQEAAARTEAAKLTQEQQRQRAYDQLMAQARVTLQQQNYGQAAKMMESALALKPNDAGTRELAQTKAMAEKNRLASAGEAKVRQEAEARRRQDAEIARTRAQVEEQNRVRAAEELARRQAQESRDLAAYNKLLADGQKSLSQGKYDDALSEFQAARQLRKTDAVEQFLNQANAKKAQSLAQKENAQKRAEMEKMATAEKAAHDRAEATAKQNREMYTLAIQQAQRAMTQKNYDVAIAKYQEAGKLFNTDAVISGLRQVADARKKDEDQTRQMALADAARKKQAELDQRLKEAEAKMLVDAKVKKEADDARRTSMVEADKKKRLADYIRAMTDGQTAMKARTYDVAVKLYTEALRLQPGDQAATAGLRNAQTMMAPPAQPSQPPPPKPAAYTLQIQAAANFAKQQKYDEALAAYTAALRIVPKDVPASVGYYLMTGQKNLKAKKNAEAVKAFEDVLRLSPNHAEATAGLKQAQQ